MIGIERLKELKLKAQREAYPNVPDKALPRPKYSDRTSNGLTRCILDFLNLKGWQAERISNTGRRLDKRKKVTNAIGQTQTIGQVKWIKSSGQNGTADLHAVIAGMPVKIEVKIGRDRLSKHQKAYKAEVERAGGLYVVARDFESFYNWYVVVIREVRHSKQLHVC